MKLGAFCFSLAIVLCFTKPITAGEFCDGKDDGNYKDPINCDGYIACSNGKTYYMDCPSGLRYDENADKCDYAENVPCDEFSCQGRPDGNYEDPGNCYGYISCSNGIAYRMHCPDDLKYNTDIDACDYPQNVEC